jgi:hypothetical protein
MLAASAGQSSGLLVSCEVCRTCSVNQGQETGPCWRSLRKRDLRLIIGGIALPNEASVGLHEKLGFRKARQFTEVGLKFGRWIDVGYWELKFGK